MDGGHAQESLKSLLTAIDQIKSGMVEGNK